MLSDRGNGQFFAVAEEEEGVGGVFGEGGDVEDTVIGDVFSEGGFGEVLVKALHVGEDFADVEFALDGGKGGYGEVAGGAIEGEDDVLDAVIGELLANRLDEPLVKLLANLLDFFRVAVEVFEQIGEFENFSGDFFSGDGDFFAVEDDTFFPAWVPQTSQSLSSRTRG